MNPRLLVCSNRAFREDTIRCPECDCVQIAHVELTTIWPIFLHQCQECGYTIEESEWESVDQEERP